MDFDEVLLVWDFYIPDEKYERIFESLSEEKFAGLDLETRCLMTSEISKRTMMYLSS